MILFFEKLLLHIFLIGFTCERSFRMKFRGSKYIRHRSEFAMCSLNERLDIYLVQPLPSKWNWIRSDWAMRSVSGPGPWW